MMDFFLYFPAFHLNCQKFYLAIKLLNETVGQNNIPINVLELAKNKDLKSRIDNQARIQAEHCSSRAYASSVLEVYKRAIARRHGM